MRYPLAPVYATPPTIALTRIQLLDSLRIMSQEEQADGELPLYSEAAVESLLQRMVPVTPLRAFSPLPGDPEVTFFPAGHILGACSVGVAGREGTVFVSGDVSVDNQRTIPGMRPPRFRADVVVFESTYGKSLHPVRSREEAKLVETVASVVEAGGKVLVPAFAIGRAQEVVLVLLRAQLLGQIPRFPIHVDGMVRATCDAYAGFPRYLQSTLRKRIEKHGDPFFGVLDTVHPVRRSEQRAEILAGPPCVIVSSSGMLTGGPSPVYARALVDGPGNLIAITGYQDEEAPGRRVLEVAQGRRETVSIDGVEVRPRCRISSYALSGHASGAQIASLIRSLRPADVFVVHGDSGARHDLAELLVKDRIGRVHLPRHGEPCQPLGRGAVSGGGRRGDPRWRRLRVTGIRRTPANASLTGESLGELAEHLRRTYREGIAFTVDELYCIWHGSFPSDEAESRRFEEVVQASPHLETHPSRLFQFMAAEEKTAGRDGPEEVGSLRVRIDDALPRDAGLIRKSYQPGIPEMVLVFAFPDIAEARLRDVLDEIFRDSGWSYSIHPQPNIAALERVIREQVPDTKLISRNASVQMEARTATIHLSRDLPPEEREEWSRALERVRELTGFSTGIAVHPGTPAARSPRDEEGRLEVNLAYQTIRNAFAQEPHAPYRVGRKPSRRGEDPRIEVAFVSPQVGARYRTKLDDLGRDIGWRLEVAQRANQNAILEEARALLRDRKIRKGPSFFPAEQTIRVTLEECVVPETWQAVEREFEERTGYRLEAEEG
jgi:Cft2 family RNA processing exonuclease